MFLILAIVITLAAYAYATRIMWRNNGMTEGLGTVGLQLLGIAANMWALQLAKQWAEPGQDTGWTFFLAIVITVLVVFQDGRAFTNSELYCEDLITESVMVRRSRFYRRIHCILMGLWLVVAVITAVFYIL